MIFVQMCILQNMLNMVTSFSGCTTTDTFPGLVYESIDYETANVSYQIFLPDTNQFLMRLQKLIDNIFQEKPENTPL